METRHNICGDDSGDGGTGQSCQSRWLLCGEGNSFRESATVARPGRTEQVLLRPVPDLVGRDTPHNSLPLRPALQCSRVTRTSCTARLSCCAIRCWALLSTTQPGHGVTSSTIREPNRGGLHRGRPSPAVCPPVSRRLSGRMQSVMSRVMTARPVLALWPPRCCQ